MGIMRHKYAILVELSAFISQLQKQTIEPKVRFFPENDTNQSSVATLVKPHEKSDMQELKQLLLDKIQSLDRHFDACIRGLSRQNHVQHGEIPCQRTRNGQPRCFTCGRTGHLATNGSERIEASPHPLPQRSYPARRSYYQPHFSYNQPQDDYRNSPQQHRRDLNLAALDQHLSKERFHCRTRAKYEQSSIY